MGVGASPLLACTVRKRQPWRCKTETAGPAKPRRSRRGAAGRFCLGATQMDAAVASTRAVGQLRVENRPWDTPRLVRSAVARAAAARVQAQRTSVRAEKHATQE